MNFYTFSATTFRVDFQQQLSLTLTMQSVTSYLGSRALAVDDQQIFIIWKSWPNSNGSGQLLWFIAEHN